MKIAKEERKRLKELKKEARLYRHKIDDICPLSHLKIGQTGEVISLNIENKIFKRRLLDMGITKNVHIHIDKEAPSGDPVNLLIRGYELCLRKKELDDIIVKVVK